MGTFLKETAVDDPKMSYYLRATKFAGNDEVKFKDKDITHDVGKYVIMLFVRENWYCRPFMIGETKYLQFKRGPFTDTKEETPAIILKDEKGIYAFITNE